MTSLLQGLKNIKWKHYINYIAVGIFAILFTLMTFGGSLPGFLTAFMNGRTLTETEAEELKRLIDSHKEG